MKLKYFTLIDFKDRYSQLTSDVFLKNGSTGQKSKLQKPRILIVDDEWNMLKLLSSFLSPQYELTIKNSAIQALKWIHEGNQPAAIICEYQLPHFDGASFIQIIKTSGLYKQIPIIILSSADNVEEKLFDLPFSIDGIIKKPFDPSHLKKTIQKSIYGDQFKLNH